MVLTLYGTDGSPPVRATLLTIKALDLDIEMVETMPLLGHTKTPEFLKMNPQHSIPTLKDGEFILWDSHVINCYLVDKYSKDDSLYPKDLAKRAIVDMRLHFDNGVLGTRLAAACAPLVSGTSKTLSKEGVTSVIEAYEYLEKFLETNNYVAGDHITIADFSIVSTITSANLMIPVAENRFSKLAAWLDKMKQLPYYNEANGVGLRKLGEFLKSMK